MFNRISSLFVVCALAVGLGPAAFGQINTLTATTLSSAIASGQTTVIQVTSATNINAPNIQSNTIGSQLYVVAPGNTRGDVMLVQAVNSTNITVRRTSGGAATGFPSGSLVLVGQPNWFYDYDPSGGCTTATVFASPWVNTKTGDQWLCSTITLSWVPGFQNRQAGNNNAQVTALVASVAGATAVNGPLQHINGTNAITSFTMGAGWNGGGFCIIPDAAFTTTATNNIGKASTAVASKTLCFTWDGTNSVFDPSY
jgi:hypothetical protein